MTTAKTPLLLGLLSAALLNLSAAAAPAEKAIEAFISPGHLFPSEGTTFLAANRTEPGQYHPLPAFDRPGGRVIGEVQLLNRHCVAISPPADCDQGLLWTLRLTSGRAIALETEEYTYGTQALMSYRASIDAPNGMAWSPVDSRAGTFWVSTPRAEVHRYEEIVSFVEEFEQWCTMPGKCAAPTAAMARELERMRAGELVVQGCFAAYSVTGIVARDGARYYRLERPEFDSQSPSTSLPAVGFTPVRNSKGGHTGTFYPRGC